MTTVSIDEAAKTLPSLLQRARSESIQIVDEDGDGVLLFSLKPKTEAQRRAANDRFDEISRRASAELEASLAKDGITVEEFLADALSDD